MLFFHAKIDGFLSYVDRRGLRSVATDSEILYIWGFLPIWNEGGDLSEKGERTMVQIDPEARRAQLFNIIDRANEEIRLIDALLRLMHGERVDVGGIAVGSNGGAPPGTRQRRIRGRALLRDVVLEILASSAPGHRMQVVQIKAALRERGRVQADEDLRGVLKKLREAGRVAFFEQPESRGYQYWAKGAVTAAVGTADGKIVSSSGSVRQVSTKCPPKRRNRSELVGLGRR